ncbi:MAG: sterol desaturase family protein [Flavobacteriaceae bacterium]
MRKYVSNKDERVRLFDNDVLEFLSRVHPATPLVLYLPVGALLIWLNAAYFGLSAASFLLFALAGFAIWTLTEYLLHRYLFHLETDSPQLQRMIYVIHGIHHDYPNDSRRLVMPPSISLPVGALVFAVFWLFAGIGPALPLLFGFGIGYLCYDMGHYAMHHLPMRKGFLKTLRDNHLRHHYETSDHAYGVSSPLWDWVFGTLLPGRARQKRARVPE